MNKRAFCSLLAVLIAVSFILPALATDADGNVELSAATQAEDDAEVQDEADAGEPDAEVPDDADADAEAEPEPEPEPEPKSFVYLDGAPQFVEYELRNGTTYVTVSSFMAVADPQAVVEEENGVVTVSSARVEKVVDDEGNSTDVVKETLSMTVSSQVPYIVANGRYLYAKDSIVTVNGQVAVPIRKLALVFNLDVGYDAEARAALLIHVQGRSAYIQPGDNYYDGDTLYWLSRIIHAESGNQVLEGKIAVGNVVMNRVNSSLFPNTLYGVLSQKNQFVSPNTLSKKNPNSESVVAAKLVMDGAEVLPTALFFNRTGLLSYAAKNRAFVTTIGNHDFYA